jgi:hypothetical protein
MMRSNLALSVADAGMSRLVTFTEYKADWRGRRIREDRPVVPVHSSLLPMPMHQFRHAQPACFRLRRLRAHDAPTCGEIGEQGMPIGMFPVPVVEPPILASEVNLGYHECQ